MRTLLILAVVLSGSPSVWGQDTVRYIRSSFTPTEEFSKDVNALILENKVADCRYFPLAHGNKWVFAPVKGGPSHVMTVGNALIQIREMSTSTDKMSSSKELSFWVDGMPGLSPTWVVPYGNTVNVIHGGHHTNPFLVFGLPLLHSYTNHYPDPRCHKVTFKVGAVRKTVVTPAGTFKNCYQLNVPNAHDQGVHVASLDFAPSVGLVRFTMVSTRIHKALSFTPYVLHYAKVDTLKKGFVVYGKEIP